MVLFKDGLVNLKLGVTGACLLTGITVSGCGLVSRSDSSLQAEESNRGNLTGSTFLVLQDTRVICFENFSTQPSTCAGFTAQISESGIAERARFVGSCEMNGLDDKATQGTSVSLSCLASSRRPAAEEEAPMPSDRDRRAGGSSCFSDTEDEGDLLKGQKVTSYSGGVWGISSGREGRDWQVRNDGQGRSCEQAFKKLECELKKRTSAPQSLALVEEATGGLSSCWQKSGIELSRCLAENADVEVYDIGSVEAASRPDGQRRPNRCFSPRPSGTYSVLVYRKMNGEMGAALAERAKVTATESAFAANLFYSFSSFRPVAANTSFNGDYPSSGQLNLVFNGQPNIETGVWRDAIGYTARFLPRGSCDQLYLGTSINVSSSTEPSRPDSSGGSSGTGGTGNTETPDQPGQPDPTAENECE